MNEAEIVAGLAATPGYRYRGSGLGVHPLGHDGQLVEIDASIER